MQWVADYGRTSRCCQSATDDDLAADPERYRGACVTCQRETRWQALWPMNQRAWGIYQSLTSRVVRDLSVQGWWLQVLTAGWSAADVVDLVQRLDAIQAVLSPEQEPSEHGRTRTDPEDHG